MRDKTDNDRHEDRHIAMHGDYGAEISSIEPLLPEASPKLAELSRSIFIEAGALCSALPSAVTRKAVAGLIREMNSYYSNLIEGHKTLPRDIERALSSNTSTDEKSANQCLASAHILTENKMEQRLQEEPNLNIHSAEFLCWLHQSFYENLPEELRHGMTVSGKKYRIEPGKLRTFNVDVGAHTPPDHNKLQAYLARFTDVYGDRNILAVNSLSAIAAAHHRLTWIHPFGDGNGRVARLYSHAALIRQKVDGLGLWTLSRGLARFRDKYYTMLATADRQRHDDYDGRGNLSAMGLTNFCVFFLETALDQIRFMGKLLELPTLLARIENHVYREATHITRHKEELCRLLKAVTTEGEIERGRVSEIVGLKPSAARQVTGLALKEGLLHTPSPKGALRIAFPAKVLDSYFPRLFLDLPYGE
jgi:Fic family protein